jgi:hypothetical protein
MTAITKQEVLELPIATEVRMGEARLYTLDTMPGFWVPYAGMKVVVVRKGKEYVFNYDNRKGLKWAMCCTLNWSKPVPYKIRVKPLTDNEFHRLLDLLDQIKQDS